MLPGCTKGSNGWRHLLLASAIALVSSTPAAAYQFYQGGWFYRPPPGYVMEPERRVRPIDRRAIREQKARQLLKEKSTPEKLPPGPLHIVISIKKQQLTLYAGGVPFAQSRVSTGVPGHPTPQGIFSILEKRVYHESNIYSSAPMPYMQRITWSGVAMHQGVVPNHPASHGCIRLPADFARRLWSLTKVGARVIIAQDDVPLTEISSKRLFTAGPQAIAEAPAAREGARCDQLGHRRAAERLDRRKHSSGSAHRARDRPDGAGGRCRGRSCIGNLFRRAAAVAR